MLNEFKFMVFVKNNYQNSRTIMKTLFKKTDAWLYQRINGNIVNGKSATFTESELNTMKFALQDLSAKLGSLSTSL